jgi:hypothetical protein
MSLVKRIVSKVVSALSRSSNEEKTEREKRVELAAKLSREAVARRKVREVYYSTRCNTRGLPRGVAAYQHARAVRLEAAAVTGTLASYSEKAVLLADRVLEVCRQVRRARHKHLLRAGAFLRSASPHSQLPPRRARRAALKKSCLPRRYVAELKLAREARGF